mgnify:CR=1 FL=1
MEAAFHGVSIKEMKTTMTEADDTLGGIHQTVTATGRVTPGQRQAVQNICSTRVR